MAPDGSLFVLRIMDEGNDNSMSARPNLSIVPTLRDYPDFGGRVGSKPDVNSTSIESKPDSSDIRGGLNSTANQL
jgi:hypothetical protein